MIPWCHWWDEEPAYDLPSRPVTRASLAVGPSIRCEGVSIAIPLKKRGDLKLFPLLVAGAEHEWPPSTTQLVDVGRIFYEVLGIPAFRLLRL